MPFQMWWRRHSDNPLTLHFLDGHTESLCSSLPEKTELLVIATKAWQVKDVIKQYKRFLLPDACVILLHNGAGTEEWTLNTLPTQSVLRMTTSKAALKKNRMLVVETGAGMTQAGWLKQPEVTKKALMENWCQTLLPDCQWFDDIRQPIWQKLAVNSVINPLTALYNIKNGQLLHPQYKDTVNKLIAEFLLVCKATGIEVDSMEIEQLVWSVIKKTSDNYSSMHQDVVNQRTTEIDYINGFLIKKAADNDLELPVNQEMMRLIKAIA